MPEAAYADVRHHWSGPASPMHDCVSGLTGFGLGHRTMGKGTGAPLADIADAQAEPEEAIKAMRAREKNE